MNELIQINVVWMVCLSVCLSICQIVYPAKTAHAIEIAFGVVTWAREQHFVW